MCAIYYYEYAPYSVCRLFFCEKRNICFFFFLKCQYKTNINTSYTLILLQFLFIRFSTVFQYYEKVYNYDLFRIVSLLMVSVFLNSFIGLFGE